VGVVVVFLVSTAAGGVRGVGFGALVVFVDFVDYVAGRKDFEAAEDDHCGRENEGPDGEGLVMIRGCAVYVQMLCSLLSKPFARYQNPFAPLSDSFDACVNLTNQSQSLSTPT
jgi:hypothetical protein